MFYVKDGGICVELVRSGGALERDEELHDWM
jgi:hypothetical protein